MNNDSSRYMWKKTKKNFTAKKIVRNVFFLMSQRIVVQSKDFDRVNWNLTTIFYKMIFSTTYLQLSILVNSDRAGIPLTCMSYNTSSIGHHLNIFVSVTRNRPYSIRTYYFQQRIFNFQLWSSQTGSSMMTFHVI